jgi:hypothetical protein
MHVSLLLLALLSVPILAAAAFQFPKIKFVGISPGSNSENVPKRTIESGEADGLRRSLETHCGVVQYGSAENYVHLRWEPYVQESYEVANVIFQEIARVARERYIDTKASRTPDTRVISCPSMFQPNHLEAIAKVLQSKKCKKFLGLEDASVELYPSSPSPYLQLTFSSPEHDEQPSNETSGINQTSRVTSESTAICDTENWVDNFLGKYNLCPYTTSVTKAAVGLSLVKVPVGSVHIVVGSTNTLDDFQTKNVDFNKLRAAELVSSFWSETVTLIQSPESEWATSLVVLPEYDNDFETFYDICDNIIQPIIEATSSTNYIGRAWFHPKYDADQVGHDSVIAGHAVPHKMVRQFIQTIKGPDSAKSIAPNDLSNANNKVRMTPHATINILRRSQLNAAAQYEKGLGDKKPTPNSIYVRNTMKLIEIMKGSAGGSS